MKRPAATLPHVSLLRAALLLAALLGAGCMGSMTGGPEPVDDLDPQKGATFAFIAKTYDVNDLGAPVRDESGVVPLEQAAIEALEGRGYSYVTDPSTARYRMEAHVLCYDPKFLGGADGPVHIQIPAYTWEGEFAPVDEEIYNVSPEVEELKMAPNACAGNLLFVVHALDEDGKTQSYATPFSVRCPYIDGCPDEACDATVTGLLKAYFSEYF